MQKTSIALQILLCMCLFVPAVQAQELAPPDKIHRQDMSYEEYAKYRENMRQQMEKMHPDKSRQSQSKGTSPLDRTEMRHHNSAYGQGYRSRNPSDRPNLARENRSERPHIERFSREDRGNRK